MKASRGPSGLDLARSWAEPQRTGAIVALPRVGACPLGCDVRKATDAQQHLFGPLRLLLVEAFGARGQLSLLGELWRVEPRHRIRPWQKNASSGEMQREADDRAGSAQLGETQTRASGLVRADSSGSLFFGSTERLAWCTLIVGAE